MRGNVDEIDNLRPEWRPHSRDHSKSAQPAKWSGRVEGRDQWSSYWHSDRGAGPVIDMWQDNKHRGYLQEATGAWSVCVGQVTLKT